MRAMLKRRTENPVNHKRVRRLMRLMGLRGIAPAPKTTRTAYTNYSNLLKDFQVTRPNQVWCADISYIKVKGGFAYGIAIMDLYSRKVLSFEISNTMDEYMCVEAAEKDHISLLITKHLMRSTMAKNTIKLQYEQKRGNLLSKYWGASHAF